MRLQQKKFKINYYALAFAIPVVMMFTVMIIGGYEPFGNSRAILYSDEFHQYYPFYVAFRKALLSGNSLLYSWNVGMGMDYLALISYYLASPLNLLCVLVPESWTLEAFSLLMPVKLGLASLFFAIFLNKLFDKNDLSISLFGSFYGMCAWALAYQWNVMWLDSFAMLPLMALGTIWLLRDKRFVLYTVILFLSIFANYYIGLFVCIFVLLIFICYEICRWPGFRRFFSDLARIAIFTVIAIGMTAVLELPALAGLQTTQSSVNKFPTTFQLNIASENTLLGLAEAMCKVASNMSGALRPSFKEGLPNIYCGIGSMLLAFIFLTSKDIKLRDKICSVFLLLFFMVSFIIRQLDYIWHGMHFTNMIPYRFSFLYSFVILYMAYRAYLLRDRFKWWQIATAGILAVAIVAMSEDREKLHYLVYNAGFLILYLGTFIYGLAGKKPSVKADQNAVVQYPPEEDTIPQYQPEENTIPQYQPEEDTIAQYQLDQNAIAEYEAKVKKRQRISSLALSGIMALELVGNIVSFGIRFPATNITDYPKGTVDSEKVIEHMQLLEADTLFYRAETTHYQILNDGALNGYNGITTFTSSANVKVTEFMNALGYGAKNTYNRYAFEEGSPVSNLFLDLKYMIERDGNEAENSYFESIYSSGDVMLLRNRYYLPLGFLSNQELATLDWNVTDHFSFQNQLFTAATGVSEDVWSMMNNYTITAEDVTLDQNDGEWNCSYSGAKKDSAIVYEFTADRDGYMCLGLNLTDRNSYTVSKNGEQLYSETLSLPQMIAVSDVKVGDTIQVRLTCKEDEEGKMYVIGAIMDPEVFRTGYDVLAASTLELTSFSDTLVEGTIECDRNGLLYTSIPQNGNWSVYVDNQEVEPTLIGDAMIGVYLTEGGHDLRFEYKNEAFSYGWKISLACLMCFVIALLVYKPNKKIGKYEK